MAEQGTRDTYSTSSPRQAKETATLASLPPKLPSKALPCCRRRKPGLDNRNMISPNVTILLFIFKPPIYNV